MSDDIFQPHFSPVAMNLIKQNLLDTKRPL